MFLAATNEINWAYLPIALIILAIIGMWIAFPFVVLTKFNELLNVQRATLKELRDARIQLARNAANPSATELDKVKALQWMIDNWPR